jgi:predicted nucleic acid-binding protein
MSPPVLEIERRVVQALIDSDDPAHRARVEAWVDGSLGDMPEVLRAGVLVESVAFAALARSRPRRTLAELLEALERNPIGLVRQYPRLFRSLVLFGDLELGQPARR